MDDFSPDLNEKRIIELLRQLQKQEGGEEIFSLLPSVLVHNLEIMVKRGADYNGKVSGVKEQVLKGGDKSVFWHVQQPVERLYQLVEGGASDEKILNCITDATNFLLIWGCYRFSVGGKDEPTDIH